MRSWYSKRPCKSFLKMAVPFVAVYKNSMVHNRVLSGQYIYQASGGSGLENDL